MVCESRVTLETFGNGYRYIYLPVHRGVLLESLHSAVCKTVSHNFNYVFSTSTLFLGVSLISLHVRNVYENTGKFKID